MVVFGLTISGSGPPAAEYCVWGAALHFQALLLISIRPNGNRFSVQRVSSPVCKRSRLILSWFALLRCPYLCVHVFLLQRGSGIVVLDPEQMSARLILPFG